MAITVKKNNCARKSPGQDTYGTIVFLPEYIMKLLSLSHIDHLTAFIINMGA